MTINEIREAIQSLADKYQIRKAVLFGSRADGTNSADSDIDLIIEFKVPVTLLTLAGIKYELEDMLKTQVDIIHGPIRDTDIIDVGKEVELYAA